MAIANIAKMVDMDFFEEESVDGGLSIFGVLDGRVVGACTIYKLNSGVVYTDLEIFDRGRNYSRPLIEKVIGVLRKMRVLHSVSLNEQSQKLRHIFLEYGYLEIVRNLLSFNYSRKRY